MVAWMQPPVKLPAGKRMFYGKEIRMRLDGWCWASFFGRWVVGLIFLMAGWFKVFNMGAVEHARRLFVEGYADTWIPAWLLWPLGVSIPFVELIGGALVCVGLRVRESLIAFGGILVIVTYGHLLKDPFHDISGHIFTRLALVVLVLMIPRERDHGSLDYWFFYRKNEE